MVTPPPLPSLSKQCFGADICNIAHDVGQIIFISRTLEIK